MISESEFHKLADITISQIAEGLEANEELEVDYIAGILTVTLGNGQQYVINKHAPTRQIWLSSPKSGAWHFSFKSLNTWVSTNKNQDLLELVSKEFNAVF